MLQRMLNPLGWLAGGVAATVVVVACVTGVLTALPDRVRAGEELWTLSWLGFPIVGAVIAGRRSDTRIGWLLILTGFSVGVGRLGGIYVNAVFAPDVPVRADMMALGSLWSFEIVGFAALAAALLHFPADRLPSPRWRLVLAVLVSGSVVYVLSSPFAAVIELDAGTTVANPFAIPVVETLPSVIPPLLVAGMLVVIADLVGRAIRSDAVERQQLKWLAYSAAGFLLSIGVVIAAQADDTSEGSWGTVLVIAAWVVCFNGLAAAIGVAVLRYRLYDIDRVASRTVTYLAVTAILLAGYTVTVVGLGRVVHALTGASDSDLVVAVSTLTVAASFGPVRRRMQDAVGRRFNRARYDAAVTIEAFAHGLRDELDPDAIGSRLRATSTMAMQPRVAGLWLREG